MRKRILLLSLAVLLAAMLAGCGSVQDMYALPKRSKEFGQLQTAIDAAMYGMTYSSPVSGENRQTVQMADLDGDGTDEYLVFAKSDGEKPLQVLIFKQEADGSVKNIEIIGSNGLNFEQVEYVDFDDEPGYELVIGQQVSDQVLRNVAVYTFSSGDAELLLMNGYSKYTTCDLDSDGKSELMVLRPGEAETQRGMAVLYSSQNGQIVRSVETELSVDPSQIRRITVGKLQDETPAVYVASSADEDTIITDVFAMRNDRFTNIAFGSGAETTIQTVSNYYVYAEDIDEDGIVELPALITMKSVSDWQEGEQNFLLRWFSMSLNGWTTDKLFTFHNYGRGWYVELDSTWAGRISVEQVDGNYHFYAWDEAYREAVPLFTVYVFTSSTRDEDANKDGRFPIYQAEGVAYAGLLEQGAADYDITEDLLIQSFHLIHQDWKTEDS